MTKVVDYPKKHSVEGVIEDQLKNFDRDFLKICQSKLFDVLIATNFLDDKRLEEVIIQEFADRIKGIQ
uniref:Uncharacterized protein n=1 Tax=Solanum lycopersicum TaxID=4081 RepID=A0A3Q7EC98_SOLLC